MPYREPEADDPHELIGVDLPGDEQVTFDMAAAFADEFAQLGLPHDAILALFRDPAYAAAHRAWQLLGDDAIAALVDDTLAVWGRVRTIVTDAPDRDPSEQPLHFFTNPGLRAEPR